MTTKTKTRPADAERRSSCPIANGLDLFGDKWTLLIVRDLLIRSPLRYGDFAASPEGMPTNILAERLKRLEAQGLVARAPYQQNPPRYEYRLTPKGLDLRAALAALREWGLKHVPGTSLPMEAVAAMERSRQRGR
jgi:DNA-binding HxlR family transcriptional regulator